MVVKVTPKPATLSRMVADRCSSPRSLARSARSPEPSATAHLLAVLAGPGDVVPRAGGPRRAHEGLPGQRRDRVSTGERVEALGGHLVPARLQRRLPPLVRL